MPWHGQVKSVAGLCEPCEPTHKGADSATPSHGTPPRYAEAAPSRTSGQREAAYRSPAACHQAGGDAPVTRADA